MKEEHLEPRAAADLGGDGRDAVVAQDKLQKYVSVRRRHVHTTYSLKLSELADLWRQNSQLVIGEMQDAQRRWIRVSA